MNQDQQLFDDELTAWLARQEPPRPADAVVDAVITRVSATHQGSQAPLLLTVAVMAAAVLVAAVLGGGLLSQIRSDPGVGPDHPPQVREDGRRMPADAVVVPFRDARTLGHIVADPGGAWVAVESTTFPSAWGAARIDGATNQVTGNIDHVWGMAWRGNDQLWAMVDVAGGTPCCDALPLSRIDPTTGDVLRTFGGVTGYELAIDGDEAWITANKLQLLRVNLDSGEIMASIELPSVNPSWEDHWITYPVIGGGAVWVAVSDDDYDGPGVLAKVDMATNRVVGTVAIPHTEELAYGQDSLWLAPRREAGGQVLRVDASALEVTAAITEPDAVWGTVINADGRIWSAVPGGIAPIDPATNQLGSTVALPWTFYWGMSYVDGDLWLTADSTLEVIRLHLPSG